MEKKTYSQREYNLPLQRGKNIVNFVDQIEIAKQLQKQKGLDSHAQIIESNSRSNSILGRKLSFCDAQLTVSQNTLETLGIVMRCFNFSLDKIHYNQKEIEALQRISAAGLQVGDALSSITNRPSNDQNDHFQSLKSKSVHSSIKKSPLREKTSKQTQAYGNKQSKKIKDDKQISFLLTFNQEKEISVNKQDNQQNGLKNKENKVYNQLQRQEQVQIKKAKNNFYIGQESRIKKFEEKSLRVKKSQNKISSSPDRKQPQAQNQIYGKRKSQSPSPLKIFLKQYEKEFDQRLGRQSEYPLRQLRDLSQEKPQTSPS